VELLKRTLNVSQKQKIQAVCVITIKKIKMSEKELKLEKQAKFAVSIPVIILVVTMLFLTSCGNVGYCIQSESLNPLKKQYSCNR